MVGSTKYETAQEAGVSCAFDAGAEPISDCRSCVFVLRFLPAHSVSSILNWLDSAFRFARHLCIRRWILASNDRQQASSELASGLLVSTGKPLFRIADLSAELQSIRARSDFKIAEQRVLSSQAGAHRQYGSRVDTDTTKAALEIARQQVETSEQELNRLLLRVPRDGKLLLMPAKAAETMPTPQADSLKLTWGSPEQLGRHVAAGTMLAAVVDSRMTAILPLNDEQLEWVAAGTEVRLRCVESGSSVYTTKVKNIVQLKDVTAAWRLVHNDLGAAKSADQAEHVEERVYAAIVALPKRRAPRRDAAWKAFLLSRRRHFSRWRVAGPNKISAGLPTDRVGCQLELTIRRRPSSEVAYS